MIAFSFGCTLSASTVASAKKGRKDSLTPSRASKSALARSRSRAISVTSASTTVVSWAEVCSDSTMRRAMTWRARDMRSVVPRRLDGTTARAEAAAAAGGAGVPGGAGGAGGGGGGGGGGAGRRGGGGGRGRGGGGGRGGRRRPRGPPGARRC